MPMSLQVSRSVSCRAVVRLGITAPPSGAGRNRLSPSTVFLTKPSSPPTTTSGRPDSRQNTACWENEFCLRNLSALSPAFLLLLSDWVPVTFCVGEGWSEELVALVHSEVSSTLSIRPGVLDWDQRVTADRVFTWRFCTRDSGPVDQPGVESSTSSAERETYTNVKLSPSQQEHKA